MFNPRIPYDFKHDDLSVYYSDKYIYTHQKKFCIS